MILNSEVRRIKNEMNKLNMMDAVKAGYVYKLSEAYFNLAKAYQHLSKELTYYISTMPSAH